MSDSPRHPTTPPIAPHTAQQYDALRSEIARSTRLLVGFSGGADSALLAYAAHDVLGEAAVAATAVSASLPAAERRGAADFCRELGIAHVEVCTDELGRPEYARNGADRCFHCKSALFDALEPLARMSGADIAVGTNLDDLGSRHRPGQTAAAQRDVRRPLADAGLTKADVRAVSAMLGLPSAAKPAAACLASRVAYGDQVTEALLARIEAAEVTLHQLGFPESRVRSHADGAVARVEVPAADLPRLVDLRDEVTAGVKAAGFTFCSLDLDGFRSGSMNALLTLTPVAPA
ncbi:ATP-dependent sacrificial sulfur transferase LarE [Nocardioides bigeumensis]|uniref:ATP-dependent sacrificial sulfur transferase LarE n=1 Tax=Nocardioides bigeumensis TaxID=433657 RepID=A0ABP5K8U4_9ACTN